MFICEMGLRTALNPVPQSPGAGAALKEPGMCNIYSWCLVTVRPVILSLCSPFLHYLLPPRRLPVKLGKELDSLENLIPKQ